MKLFDAGPQDRSTSLGLLALRIAAGGMMLKHGIPKLVDFAAKKDVFPDPLGIGSAASLASAVGAEVGCSVLLILGLRTRLAALPLAFTMGVAAFVVHGANPWAKKELALLYGAVYITVFFTGAGRFSLDGRRRVSPG